MHSLLWTELCPQIHTLRPDVLWSRLEVGLLGDIKVKRGQGWRPDPTVSASLWEEGPGSLSLPRRTHKIERLSQERPPQELDWSAPRAQISSPQQTSAVSASRLWVCHSGRAGPASPALGSLAVRSRDPASCPVVPRPQQPERPQQPFSPTGIPAGSSPQPHGWGQQGAVQEHGPPSPPSWA